MLLSNELILVSVLCMIGSQGKPTLSFDLNNFSLFGGGAGSGAADGSSGPRFERETPSKVYSGRRVKNDSLRMVYYFEQTVAVVELGPKKLLLNCELVEVYDEEEALRSLGELQQISRPLQITFDQMMELMSQCSQIENNGYAKTTTSSHVRSANNSKGGVLSNNPITLLSGIIPGTKWCGTGDIADNYHDLGVESEVDKCCRAHDLCPVKIRAYTKRYNLTNNSLYTKSHCKCDDRLFECLKRNAEPTAHLMGQIYFNLVQVPCVDETMTGKRFRPAKNNF